MFPFSHDEQNRNTFVLPIDELLSELETDLLGIQATEIREYTTPDKSVYVHVNEGEHYIQVHVYNEIIFTGVFNEANTRLIGVELEPFSTNKIAVKVANFIKGRL